ncbi:hypothetical protein ACQ5SO_05305 [Rhodovulum sp. DZ06]|uniref:hypothetical protein n=1 Tax=Rhodovulum sp. DZ06 TaxID=3425126 RepID=UPI003D34E7AB
MTRRLQRRKAIAARLRRRPRAKHGLGTGGLTLRWLLRRLGSLVIALSLAFVALAAVLSARLAVGPVSLGGLARYAAARIEAEAPGLSVSVADLTLDLSRADLPPGLRAEGLVVRVAETGARVSVPAAALRFHLADLLEGRVAPTSVTVSGMELTLVRGADGALMGGVGFAETDMGPHPDPADAGAAPPLGLAAVLRAAEAAQGPFGRLAALASRDMRLVFEDRVSKRTWTAEGVQLHVARGAEGLTATLTAADPAAPPWLRIDAARGFGTGETAVELKIADGAGGPALAAALPELAVLAALEAPLSGEIRARLTDAGAVRAAEASLVAGAGRVAGIDGDAGRLSSARLELELHPDDDRLELRRAVIEGGLGRVDLSGGGVVERDADGRPDAARLSLDLAALELGSEAGFAAPMSFGPGRVEGRFERDRMALTLDEARIETGDLVFAASGGARRGPGGWSGSLRAAAERPVPAAALGPHWPVGLAPGARDWVVTNILGGVLDTLVFAADFGADGGFEGRLDFDFHDVTATPVQGLPALTGARGAGAVILPADGTGRFEIAVDEAVVTPEGGVAIAMDGSRFVIPDVEAQIPEGFAYITAAGAVSDVMAVIDSPPLGLISRLGADLGPVDGAATLTAELSLPLLADVSIDAVEVSTAAQIEGLSLVVPGIQLPANAARAELKADTSRLELTASGALDGMPISAAWTETFSPEDGAPPTLVTAAGPFGPALLERAGIDALSIPEGRGRMRAVIAVPRSGPVDVRASVDLTGAALRLARPAWGKAAGVAASAEARLRIGETIELRSLKVDAPGLALSGAATLGGDGALRNARLDRVSIDGTVEGAASYIAGAPASLRFEGALLDLSALGGGDGEAGGGGGALTGEATAERLRLTESLALHGGRAAFSASAAGGLKATLTGALGGAAPLQVEYDAPAGGDAATLALASSDAGALLREAAGFEAGAGGALRADARLRPPSGDGVVEGRAVIEGMSLRGDSSTVRALAAASITGVFETAGGGALLLSRIEAPFRWDGTRLTVTDALARGPSLGVTLSGDWWKAEDRLDMAGVMSPAYAINGILNEVPLLGALLGGKGEGLLGVTFTLTGASGDPKLTANPLSALTPGALRGVFEGRAAPAPAAQAPARAGGEAPTPQPAPARPAPAPPPPTERLFER